MGIRIGTLERSWRVLDNTQCFVSDVRDAESVDKRFLSDSEMLGYDTKNKLFYDTKAADQHLTPLHGR